MAVASRVTVASTATEIVPSTTGDRQVNIRNRGTVAVYLGGSAVTTATGYQIDEGEAVGYDLRTGDAIYGIVASGTAVVHLLSVEPE